MRDLLALESEDVRAAEAVALFCYQGQEVDRGLRGGVGRTAHAGVRGGIGENAPAVRARICDGLGFLGIETLGRAKMLRARA